MFYFCGVMGRISYRHASNTRIPTIRDHLTLLLTVEKVVVVLHADELVPAMLLGHILECLELPSWHLFILISICSSLVGDAFEKSLQS